MIRRISTLLLTIVALLTMASIVGYAQLQPALTRHTRDVTLSGEAHSLGHMPGNQSMDLVLVLPLRNEVILRSLLHDLYDPSSTSYRHFLTVEEFTESYGPSQSDYDNVSQWARQNGFAVVKTSRNRMTMHVKGSVANVEQAFHVTMGVYQHPSEARTFFAPDREPTSEVRLFRIAGLDNFSTPHRNLVRRDENESLIHPNATTGSCPGAAFCASDMRAAYYGQTTLTGAGQSLGLFEFLGTDLQDITTYYHNTGQTNNVPITLLSVDGVTTNCVASQGCDDTEQTLDITQALGMAPGMDSLVFYVGQSTGLLDDAGILNAMATASPLNNQLSCSWAWRPPDPSSDDPFFMEFAAQGQTFFVAAGDNGRWSSALPFVWPADDPFIVSVGGTSLKTTGPAGGWASETVWSGSGGGITPNNFPIQSWQTAAAAGCTNCSKTLRNGPDVSANAEFSFYVCANQTACTSNVWGGTSFSSPMWAGLMALANEQAASTGQPNVGFINPAVYTIGGGSTYGANFHDTTVGSNGWPATVGYDLSTGWGSPIGATLINSLTSSGGSPNFTVSAAPKRLVIARGGSGTATITTSVSGGFNSTIALSASLGSVTFNPKTIPAPGNGTSTMTINVGANVPVGVHTITVTGNGGSTTKTVVIKVKVT